MPNTEVQNNGIASTFIDAINRLWELVDQYNSMLITFNELDRHEFDDTLNELAEGTSKQIGMMQGMLECVDPEVEATEEGKDSIDDSLKDSINEDLYSENDSQLKSEIDTTIEKLALNVEEELNRILASYVRTKYNKKYIFSHYPGDAEYFIKKVGSRDVVAEFPAEIISDFYDEKYPEYVIEICKDLNSLIATAEDKIDEIIEKDLNESLNEAVESELKDELVSEGSLEDFDVDARISSVFKSKEARTFLLDRNDVIYHITVKPGEDDENSYLDIITSDKYNRNQARVWMQAFSNEDDLSLSLEEWIEEQLEEE